MNQQLRADRFQFPFDDRQNLNVVDRHELIGKLCHNQPHVFVAASQFAAKEVVPPGPDIDQWQTPGIARQDGLCGTLQLPIQFACRTKTGLGRRLVALPACQDRLIVERCRQARWTARGQCRIGGHPFVPVIGQFSVEFQGVEQRLVRFLQTDLAAQLNSCQVGRAAGLPQGGDLDR